MRSEVSITNKTNGTLPRVPFVRLKNAILSPSYELGVAFVTPRESHKLNLIYRKKDKPTNILSFPLEKNSGEIVIDLATSRADAPNFDMSESKFLLFLVIHGMLHLKGLEHGSTMEAQEKKFLEIFS